jgi:Ribosomal proteins 50S-L18Ae/60S-L20/60S-L18A
MRIFAPNDVVAKSRFWYFLGRLRKVKKANGEVVSLNQVRRSSRGARRGLILVDPREAPPEGEELRRLDPLRLALGNTQHVQGVQGNVEDRGDRVNVRRHGGAPPRALQVDPRSFFAAGCLGLANDSRSSGWSSSRRRRTCGGRTSSNSYPRTSSSRCRIACRAPSRRRRSCTAARRLSFERFRSVLRLLWIHVCRSYSSCSEYYKWQGTQPAL